LYVCVRNPVCVCVHRKWLLECGITNVVELDWWQTHDMGGGFKAVCTPAQHFSGRSLWDRNECVTRMHAMESGMHAMESGMHAVESIMHAVECDMHAVESGMHTACVLCTHV